MLRDLLSSRWFQFGLGFFVLVVGCSLLYSGHVQRTIEAEFGKRPLVVETLENKPETSTAPVDFQTEGVTNTPDETTDTPTLDETAALPNDTENLDLADAFLPDDMGSEEAPAEEEAVSPFGFGPYPKLPEGWEADFPPVSVKHELMVRVAVKLREQGIDVAGASMEDGFVFPNIKGIYYVKWDETDEGVRYITEGTGHPEDGNRLHAIRMEKGEPLTETDIPSGIKLVSYEEGRIEPYEFLGLSR